MLYVCVVVCLQALVSVLSKDGHMLRGQRVYDGVTCQGINTRGTVFCYIHDINGYCIGGLRMQTFSDVNHFSTW
jgi:hypothetical protein